MCCHVCLCVLTQYLDLNNASDTGLPGNPAMQGRILPDFFQSPNPNVLIFPVSTSAHDCRIVCDCSDALDSIERRCAHACVWLASWLCVQGWTASGWYLPTSFAHSHSLLSCSPLNAPSLNGGQPLVHIALHNPIDYSYGLSVTIAQSVRAYQDLNNVNDCSCRATVGASLFTWIHWAVSMDTWTNDVSIYANGLFIKTCNCIPVQRVARKFCFAGKDHMHERFGNGRIAAYTIYDYAMWSDKTNNQDRNAPETEQRSELNRLWAHGAMLTLTLCFCSLCLFASRVRDFEVLQVYTQNRLPLAAPFTVDPYFSTRIPSDLPVSLRIYTPHSREFAHNLTLWSNVTGVLPTNPFVLRWTNNDNAAKSLNVRLPVNVSAASINFTACCNPRFLAPETIVLTLHSQDWLLAEAIHTVSITTKPAHADFLPSPYVAGVGTALLAPPPPLANPSVENKQYVDLNDASDTNTTSTVDRTLIARGFGWTYTAWMLIDTVSGPPMDHWLFAMWKTGAQDQAIYLRTSGNCLLFGGTNQLNRGSDTGFWNVCPSYSQVRFGCGSWSPDQWFSLAIINNPQTVTTAFYLNAQLIHTVTGVASTLFGEYDNHRVGSPPYVYAAASTASPVYQWGDCWCGRQITSGRMPYCLDQITNWDWPTYTSGIRGQFAEARLWARPLLSWELTSAYRRPPPNVSPVAFVNRSPQYQALAWGRSDSFALATSIDFSTHPILTLRLSSPDSAIVDFVTLNPPVDVPIDMSNYLYTAANPTMLVFTITAKAFPNNVQSYTAPSITITFEQSGQKPRSAETQQTEYSARTALTPFFAALICVDNRRLGQLFAAPAHLIRCPCAAGRRVVPAQYGRAIAARRMDCGRHGRDRYHTVQMEPRSVKRRAHSVARSCYMSVVLCRADVASCCLFLPPQA